MESKRNDTKELPYKIERDRLRECIYGFWEKVIVREFRMDVFTLLYLKWISNKYLLYSTWNCAQCYRTTWMGGEFGEEWIHIYVWLSPFAVHLKLSQHC